MTGRERIGLAFQNKEADRIPLDFNGHRSSGIMAKPYIRLRELLGLPRKPLYVYDFIQQLVHVDDDVLDAVGADVVEIGHNYFKKNDYWVDSFLPDGTPCKLPGFVDVEKTDVGNIVRGDDNQIICIQKKEHLFYEQTCFPYFNNDDADFKNLHRDLQQIMWCRIGLPPAPAGLDTEEGLKIISENAAELRASTDRAIYATFGGNLIEIGEFAFRIDNFLLQLAMDPDRIHKFLDKLVEYHLSNMEKYLGAVGENIDLIGFGDDLGMQTGTQISPDMYREFFKPRHKLLWNHAKKLCPGVKVSLHSCGSIYSLIPDLIEAGLDAVNPVQMTCKDMELDRLKREFGKDLVFWGGGADTRTVLPKGTIQEVKDDVRRNIETMRHDGGFVFQQVHNILEDVSGENVHAMFEALREV
jgi:uroporphyrinogen decarboxylase